MAGFGSGLLIRTVRNTRPVETVIQALSRNGPAIGRGATLPLSNSPKLVTNRLQILANGPMYTPPAHDLLHNDVTVVYTRTPYEEPSSVFPVMNPPFTSFPVPVPAYECINMKRRKRKKELRNKLRRQRKTLPERLRAKRAEKLF